METIYTTDSASQFVQKVNTNFGSEAISIDDTATEVVSILNDALSTDLSVNDSATELVAVLNEVEPQPIEAVVKFLHLSDPHGYDSATKKAKKMLLDDSDDDYDAELAFVFVTGDMTTYGYFDGISNGLTADFTAIGDKLLMLAGNHDTYENNFGSYISQKATTDFLKYWIGDRVVWGDQNGVASYWYKDVQLASNAKLRIISLDQYEIDVMNRYRKFYTMYSQAQVNWLIARLKELRSSDYVIIATHEPPVQNQSKPDAYAQAMSVINGDQQKLFMTNGLYSFGNRGDEPNLNLLPRIMRAYIHKETLNITYNNKGGSSSNPDITINETFSGNPATFLFWLGGHQHADICYYLPDESNATLDGGDFSDQLMLYVTAADRSVIYSNYDDLGGAQSELPTPSSPSQETYRINEYEIDFGAKTIKVTRIGDKNTSDGRVRSSVTFPFKKGGES